MKLQTMLGVLLAALMTAIVSVFRREREDCWNEASTTKTHANGQLPRVVEAAAITTRHLLVQKGTADDGIIVNVANTRPLGVITDEGAVGATVNVALLGVTPGTILLRAAKAIAVGAKLYTAAGGKVTDAHSTGAFFVGRAVSAAAADGDLIEVQHVFPMLDASGTTL